MGAIYAELTLDQGADFSSAITLTNDDGSVINCTNYQFSSQIRKSYYSANATADFVVSSSSDFSNGEVVLTLTAANTANIKPGRYLYDLKMSNTPNGTLRVVEGIITVTPQVTR